MKKLPSIFCYEDVKDLFSSKNSFYVFVCRANKNGVIKQIKKGLYALVDRLTGDVYANKFQIASRLFDDSYFSYHEALDYYGLATQSFVSIFTYISHVYVNDVIFDEIVYKSKKMNTELEIVDRMKEEGVRVVSLERAIVDCIDSPSQAGGIDEVENALAFCPMLDLDVVSKLLNYYGKAFLYQKVGYLFEKHFGEKIPDSFYQMCLSNIGNKLNYFEAIPRHSKLVLKWKLLVPLEGDLPDEFI